MLNHSELEEVMNVFGCKFFPLSSLVNSIELKKGKKSTKYYRKDFMKALHIYNSNPDVYIRFDFIEDLYIRADSFAFDLLYLR